MAKKQKGLWKKIREMNDDDVAFLVFGIIMILLMFNLFCWISYIEIPNCVGGNFNKTDGDGCEKVFFDYHGLSGWHYLILSLVIIEVSFIVLTYLMRKKNKESIWDYVLLKKLQAFGCLVAFYFAVFPVCYGGFSVVKHFPKIIPYLTEIVVQIGLALCVVLGIVTVVALYYLMNVGIAKFINRNNKKRKTKRRRTSCRRIRRS